jgi:hypothetical protein
MKEQTAVEWLFEKLWNTGKDKFTWYAILKQAKEMEKEQIIKAVDYCLESVKISDDKTMFTATTAEQYYHETYESNTRI